MPLRALTTLLRFCRIRLLSASFLALIILALPHASATQQHNPPTLQGYVTALNLPASIDVNHQRVHINLKTVFYQAANNFSIPDYTRGSSIRKGTYLFVFGAADPQIRSITAQKILLGDPGWSKSLSGLGVIERVISTGRQPVFESDGYRIRITPATEVDYSRGLKSLADITTNVWLKYEGRLDDTGTLVATKAHFIAPRLSRLKRSRTGVPGGNTGPKSKAKATGHKSARSTGSNHPSSSLCSNDELPPQPTAPIPSTLLRVILTISLPLQIASASAPQPRSTPYNHLAPDHRSIAITGVTREVITGMRKKIQSVPE